MTRYLLDTNIISNMVRPAPPEGLARWLSTQLDHTLFTSAMTLAEVRHGILTMVAGRRRDQLQAWFSGPEGPNVIFRGRILSFDQRAAMTWAALMAEGKSLGRPRDPVDMIIAATAQANRCILVTDNERDFWGIDLINPVRTPP